MLQYKKEASTWILGHPKEGDLTCQKVFVMDDPIDRDYGGVRILRDFMAKSIDGLGSSPRSDPTHYTVNIEGITLNDHNDHMVAKVEGGFTLCDKCNLKVAEGGFTPCDNCETDMAESEKRNAKANNPSGLVKFHEILRRSVYIEVENTSADNAMTFSDKDLPPKGTVHPPKLYISVDVGEKLISRVLIDSGSDFNICPLDIVRKLGMEERIDKINIMVARGFDGTERENIGQIELLMRVGPTTFRIKFHVFDIPCTSYNLILGAAWINDAKVLHSSVHQSLKFVFNNKTITVHAEKDFAVSSDTAGEPSSKRRLGIKMVSHMPERSQPPQLRFSNKTIDESLDTIICDGPISVFEFEKYAAETEEEVNELADLDLSDEGLTTIIGVEEVGLAA
ncbi:uncharacterized protein LOC132312379 [Cornus florida]|uniref:uncharacterized protein LOC132312379 n=1 Tax=Cornus florida TaxID=4283 RepID=UPI0028A08898|nr:uncharacterized protein LOC132312379 [Cornus florida]